MKSITRLHKVKGKKFLLCVETSSSADDYLKYENLRFDVWGFPEDGLPGSRNMMCESFLHEGSSLFIAAYREDDSGTFFEDTEHIVGFSYGYVGVKDKTLAFKSLDNLNFYSQYTGVRKPFRQYGLGILIKEFQRDVVLDTLGIETITCTFDPLTGVNALRNIHHFGMQVQEYRVSTYGEYGGLLNRGDVPSDRFFMSWDLRRKNLPFVFDPAVLAEERRQVVVVTEENVPAKTGPVVLEKAQAINLAADEDLLLVRIPGEFYGMLGETDVSRPDVRGIPVAWRLKTREAFLSLFKRGYRVADFVSSKGQPRRNFYVLLRGAESARKR